MKDTFNRIIIPVDNTEASKLAVKKGAFLAKLLGIDAKIITVNDTYQFISSVVLEDKLKKEAEAFLDDFKKIAEVCRKYGILMIDDEIQMGFFRTGKMWSIEHFGITPDIIVFGKAFTNGLILYQV